MTKPRPQAANRTQSAALQTPRAARANAKASIGVMGVDPRLVPTDGRVTIHLTDSKPSMRVPQGCLTTDVAGAEALCEFMSELERTRTLRTQHANEILRQAAMTIEARAAQRDNTNGAGERSMAATVTAFNAIEGTNLTERQGWAFMQTLKQVRAATSARNGKADEDSALDGAAYAALAGEAASREDLARHQAAATATTAAK